MQCRSDTPCSAPLNEGRLTWETSPITQDICYIALSSRNYFVYFGRLDKVLSVHVPITHINCLVIVRLRAHLLHKRIVSGPREPQDQESRKGCFSKGGFCRIRCQPQEQKIVKVLGSSVHSALRAPQSREAYTFVKTRFQTPPPAVFLVPQSPRKNKVAQK